MVASLRFAKAVERPLPKITADDRQITLKIYAPLPYGTNWEELDPIQKSFKKEDAFYNMVERRYVNDTLYFTLQRNLNAHDAFDALSSIVNTFVSAEHQKAPSSHNAPSATDFMTVFPPSTPPDVVFFKHNWPFKPNVSVWHYAFSLPIHCAPVLVPPPDWV